MKNSNVDVRPYVLLMRKALGRSCSLQEFAYEFMNLFQEERGELTNEIYEILNGVYLDSDEYEPSNSPLLSGLKEILPQFVIDDDEFVSRIKIALATLSGHEG